MAARLKFSRFLGVLSVMLLLTSPSGPRGESNEPSKTSANEGQVYSLLLYNTHTGERINVVYRQGDQYITSSLSKLDYFLRDHRTGSGEARLGPANGFGPLRFARAD